MLFSNDSITSSIGYGGVSFLHSEALTVIKYLRLVHL